MKLRSYAGAVLPACLILALGGCDFQAAQDAFDEVGVVIELQPIHTVATARLLDASTLRPIGRNVQVAFGGDAGAKIIDVYSDPLSEVTVGGGLFSFGIDNSLEPSEDRPVQFTVTVSADGYQTRTKTITLFEAGSNAFAVRLMPDDVNAPVKGTAGERTTVATTNGTTTTETTIQTPETSETHTSATITIPAGTQALAADGTPLTGNWTVDVRYFDNSPAALEVLPDEAKVSDSGQPLLIAGALSMRITAGNQVASRLVTSGGRAADKVSSPPDIFLPFIIQFTSQTYNLVNRFGVDRLTARYASPGLSSFFNLQWTNRLLSLQNNIGALSGFLEFASPPGLQVGPYGTISFGYGDTVNQDAAATATVNLNGHTAGQVTIQLTAPGVSKERVKDIAAGATTLTTNLANWAKDLPAIEGYQLVAVDPDGNASEPIDVDPFQGAYSLTLPAPVGGRIDVNLVLDPNCPGSQRVPLVGSLDGLTINFQREGGAFRTMAAADVDIETTSTRLVRATGILRQVLPSTQYTIYATLGSDNQQQVITTPATAGTVTMDATELRKHCQ